MYTKSLHNHYLINVYKNYKNCLMKILKYTEKKYYENKIKNNNIKNTWRTLNKVIGNNKKSGTIIDNKLTDLQNANMFNSYFSNIGVELNKNIPSLIKIYMKILLVIRVQFYKSLFHQ